MDVTRREVLVSTGAAAAGVLTASLVGPGDASPVDQGRFTVYIGHFSFDVDPAEQEAFLDVVRERIRPHWMSTGRCWDYSVYQEWDAASGKPASRFLKIQVMEGTPGAKERTAEDREAIDLFYKYARNVSIRVFVKKI